VQHFRKQQRLRIRLAFLLAAFIPNLASQASMNALGKLLCFFRALGYSSGCPPEVLMELLFVSVLAFCCVRFRCNTPRGVPDGFENRAIGLVPDVRYVKDVM
jgi:hypothetical protein